MTYLCYLCPHLFIICVQPNRESRAWTQIRDLTVMQMRLTPCRPVMFYKSGFKKNKKKPTTYQGPVFYFIWFYYVAATAIVIAPTNQTRPAKIVDIKQECYGDANGIPRQRVYLARRSSTYDAESPGSGGALSSVRCASRRYINFFFIYLQFQAADFIETSGILVSARRGWIGDSR